MRLPLVNIQRAQVVKIGCAPTHVVNQFVTDANGRYRGTLPAGTYQLRINGPNRAAGSPANPNITVATGSNVVQDFTLPRPAFLQILVNDGQGRAIAAKVSLIGNSNSPDSNEPLNSESVAGGVITVRSGIFLDPFSDPLPAGMALIEFAVADKGSGDVIVGDTGILPVEPGTYELSVSHGTRFDEFKTTVTLSEGNVTRLPVTLNEVVPTPGYIAADFHVHSFQSLDSDVQQRDRVSVYLAEGFDFFTPSDHEIRVDFAPTMRGMGVTQRVATAPAAEITTLDYGHFIGWPVSLKTTAPALLFPGINASADPSLSRGSVDLGISAPPGSAFPSKGFFQRTLRELLDITARDPAVPGRQVVRQINHIYSFFGKAGMQIDTGVVPPRSTANPSAKRLNPAWSDSATGSGNFYTDAYDALELWIGVEGRETQSFFLNEDMGDWFNLLNQGRRRTGMSNSDSHTRRLTGQITRNLIPLPTPLTDGTTGQANINALNADPHSVGDAVIAGRNLMTNGPFVRAKVRNATGQTASLEPSDAFGTLARPLPLESLGERAQLSLTIQSPVWAAYDQVQVYVNSHTVRQTDQAGVAASPPRYNPCTGTVFSVGTGLVRNTVSLARGGQRYESNLTVPLPNPGRDYWVVVRVQGRDGVSPPLWPIEPATFNDSGDGLTTRSAGDIGVNALAVTNPIYVDADGDGRWTPPGVMTHNGSLADRCPTGTGTGLPSVAGRVGADGMLMTKSKSAVSQKSRLTESLALIPQKLSQKNHPHEHLHRHATGHKHSDKKQGHQTQEDRSAPAAQGRPPLRLNLEHLHKH